MLSIDNTYSEEEVKEFDARVRKLWTKPRFAGLRSYRPQISSFIPS